MISGMLDVSVHVGHKPAETMVLEKNKIKAIIF